MTYLLPVVALTLGIVVLGEAVSWTLFAGTALVLIHVDEVLRASQRQLARDEGR